MALTSGVIPIRVLGEVGFRRRVPGRGPLPDGPREHADEPVVLDDRDAFEIALLQGVERLVERPLRVEREERRLGNVAEPYLPRVEAGRDHFANERLARYDTDEASVVRADEDGAHLGILREEPPGLLRARAVAEHRRLRHHRLADYLHGLASHSSCGHGVSPP